MKSGMVLGALLSLFAHTAMAQSLLDELSAAEIDAGERLFRVHCARCHGIDGAGGEGSNLARSKLKFASDDESLIAVIDSGIAGTGMPAIWTLDDVQTRQVAGYVRTLGRIEAEEMPGDPVRGASLYNESGGCPACHIIGGHGIGIGPELTFVGDQRGRDYLRMSLTDPAAAQSQTRGYQDYLTVRARTADRRVEGLRVNEDAFTIQIRDIAGTVHSLRKDQLLEFEKVFAHSLMPEYATSLTADDVNDLVSYLMSLRSES